MEKFKKAICIKNGIYHGVNFSKGDIYPISGTNNGLHLVFENLEQDAEIMMLFGYESENNKTELHEWSLDVPNNSEYPVFTWEKEE